MRLLARPMAAVPVLLLASSVVQTCCLARAVTVAQDGVRLAGMAAQIQREGIQRSIARGSDPPLFPLFVLVARHAVDRVLPDTPRRWALAVQGAAAIAVIGSVLPVYALARILFGATAALFTGLTWCVLPEVCRLGADGLADSTQLALFATAAWCAAKFFAGADSRERSSQCRPWWMLAAGAACGTAMLARSESVLLLPAIFLAVAACRLLTRRQQCFAAGALAAGVSLVWGPYLWLADVRSAPAVWNRVVGHYDGVPAAGGFLGHVTAAGPAAPNLTDAHLPAAGGQALSFPHKDPSRSSRRPGVWKACGELARELAQAWCYWIGGLAIAGGWMARKQIPRWFRWQAGTFTGLMLAAAWLTSARWGYLSTRHLLLLTPLGLGLAGVALAAAATSRRWGVWGRAAALVCLAGCLPAALSVRHASRAAHRGAADWLSTHAAPCDRVLDTRGWTAMYSGRDTYRFTAARAALLDARLAYVVVEREELRRSSQRAQSLRWTLDRFAEPAAEFGEANEEVAVYRWNARRFAAAAAARALGN